MTSHLNTKLHSIGAFQETYKIPKTNIIDPTTWMSLLISKGDTDRKAIACDTRFEITSELLAKLKGDGYQIVGRYLTEPGQAGKKPADYFKAIRPGELERITKGGLKYFPIFQEYSTKLEHFTPASGARHAKEAQAAAQRLGIPPTVIYFAVDFDVYGHQISQVMAPYFKAVTENLGGGYRVGIYASRNVCTQIAKLGYAVSSFVSDMSTGFSGNLGYPIPANWNYDQFHEIKKYGGKWDLDKVAYSGRIPAVDAVRSGQQVDYSLMDIFDLLEALENRFEELRIVYKKYAFGQDPLVSGHTTTWIDVPTWRCILNYLSKVYLNGNAKWALSAEAFRSGDAKRLEDDPKAQEIIATLGKWIEKSRDPWRDPSGGMVDIAHMTVTTLGYLNTNPGIPDKWTGWAGDLASALGPIQTVVNDNPGVEPSKIAQAFVGQGNNYRNHPGIRGLKVPAGIPNNCNFSDLCSDGDAIALADLLSRSGGSNPNLLSQTLRGYYNNRIILSGRFKEIAHSVGANDLESAKKKFFNEIDGSLNNIYVDLLVDGEDGVIGYSDVVITDTVKQAACQALAEFIY